MEGSEALTAWSGSCWSIQLVQKLSILLCRRYSPCKKVKTFVSKACKWSKYYFLWSKHASHPFRWIFFVITEGNKDSQCARTDDANEKSTKERKEPFATTNLLYSQSSKQADCFSFHGQLEVKLSLFKQIWIIHVSCHRIFTINCWKRFSSQKSYRISPINCLWQAFTFFSSSPFFSHKSKLAPPHTNLNITLR